MSLAPQGRQGPVEISDPDDPRLADYRRLTDRQLNAEGGRFVAESERVVRRLIGERAHRALRAADAAAAGHAGRRARRPVSVFVAAQPVLDAIAGFHVHRGCLAIGERPAPAPLPPAARALVVAEDLTDVDNLGALARHAAGFGADGLMLSPRCADPFYRKAIRVSLGAVFSLPILRARRWPGDLEALRAARGSPASRRRGGWASTPGDATPLARFSPPPRFALLLGAEGPGLSAAARAACDHLVTIPMSAGADSLNVATAGAIFLCGAAQREPPPPAHR